MSSRTAKHVVQARPLTSETLKKSRLIAPQVTQVVLAGCKRALEAAMLAVERSKQLREDVRLKLTNAIIRQKTAHCIVNDGLLKKVAETVDLKVQD